MEEYKVMDGNEACAHAAYLFTEVLGIYPITPATPMATLCDKWAQKGEKNIFNEKVKVIEMESEAGASALVHGALTAGSLSTTFTSSQGLLLMIPTMYKISGEMLPLVMHVSARSLSTHALSIFGDHQDVYAVRDTGFVILASTNVEDAYNLALVAHLSAITSSIPHMHFFDGFRTSHELNKVRLLDKEEIYPLIDMESLNEFRNKGINIDARDTRGTSQTEDIYFQVSEAKNQFYNNVPSIVNNYMERINMITGKDYKPFNYYGSKNAKRVIISMGSVSDTVKLVVDEFNKEGIEVGCINVHLFRPFSIDYFLKVLPKSTEKVTVLERSKTLNEDTLPLYLDVVNALKEEKIEVYGGRYGLSGKNTTPGQIKSVFDNMDKLKPINSFTIGIDDDVTFKSLHYTEFKISKKFKEIKIYGYGSDGMVSASKNILKLLGNSDDFVQGYFEYDSKKSGGVTVSHLRISDEYINAPYYLENPSLITVTRENYLNEFDILNGVHKNGILLLNTEKSENELNEYLNNKVKSEIKNKNLKFFICNVNAINKKYNLRGKINNVMSIYILKMLGCNSKKIEEFKELVLSFYKNKEKKILSNNIMAMDEAMDYITEVDINNFTVSEDKTTEETFEKSLQRRNGNLLPVSHLLPYKDGIFKNYNTNIENKNVLKEVPVWNKNSCIECNLCSLICPHSVLSAHLLNEDETYEYNIDIEDTKESIDKRFYINVSEDICTSCGLCSEICPGKNGEKALKLEEKEIKVNNEIKKHINNTNFDKFTVKGFGFLESGLENPGSCAGCGESAYLKILSTLFKEEIVIANATGCSSIYGGSLPILPYKVPWVSSLFEDNAEFGYGIYSSYKLKREMIKDIMYETKDIVSKEVKSIYKKWIDNIDDYSITREVLKELEDKDIPNELKELLKYIPSRTVWIVGGDGWAYDIGYNGIDHILHSSENVNILVLDTEVYSNTGGQMSKSTKTGSIAEFASNGKNNVKKDLFKIAMSIPNVYVASISLEANPMQTLKTFKEAYNHNGPSLIIAYSPCISHGIEGGMRNSINESKLLAESGYNLLMRYNPIEKKLYMDSKEPDFSRYEEVFKKELRYKNLENINKENYEELYNKNIDSAKERYEYFKNMSSK